MLVVSKSLEAVTPNQFFEIQLQKDTYTFNLECQNSISLTQVSHFLQKMG